MGKRFYTKNIRVLLTKGFNAEELRRFCFDTPDFRPVYEQLAENMGKDEIIQRIIVYADKKIKVEPLLEWTKEEIPERYKKHQPYYDYDPARILIVDDIVDWREQLGGLLEDEGCEVVTAGTKEEALLQCIQQSGEFSLAIIDMRLDEGDEENREGIELGISLRENGYEFPIFILTAYKMTPEDTKKFTRHPLRFVAVEKAKIGSGDDEDLYHQVKYELKQRRFT